MVKPGQVFYDIGANIGQYGIYAALRAGADTRVVCFEPESANFATLNANIVMNGIATRVTAYLVALSDATGIGTLQVVDASMSGGALHQLDADADQIDVDADWAGFHPQGVLTTSLDELVYARGLPCPNHVKIDVDGHEPAIVRGAARLLTDERLLSVLIELDNPIERVRAAFAEAGFAVSLEQRSTAEASTMNVVFERP